MRRLGFVSEGVVKDLNTFYKERAIRCYDCILAVNGFRPSMGEEQPSASLMNAIKDAKGKDLEFIIGRYYSKVELDEVMKATIR